MGLFARKKVDAHPFRGDGKERGLLVFENTSEVIRAEKLLKEKGYEIRVVGPPPEIRKGCDLAIEFPLIYQLKIQKLLEEMGIPPLLSKPLKDSTLRPVDLFKVRDYGRFLMVRAANMKLTIDKESSKIVNVSGGGCPDVPYLSKRLMGHTLSESPEPKDLGHTLCGYALQLAFEEIKRISKNIR